MPPPPGTPLPLPVGEVEAILGVALAGHQGYLLDARRNPVSGYSLRTALALVRHYPGSPETVAEGAVQGITQALTASLAAADRRVDPDGESSTDQDGLADDDWAEIWSQLESWPAFWDAADRQAAVAFDTLASWTEPEWYDDPGGHNPDLAAITLWARRPDWQAGDRARLFESLARLPDPVQVDVWHALRLVPERLIEVLAIAQQRTPASTAGWVWDMLPEISPDHPVWPEVIEAVLARPDWANPLPGGLSGPGMPIPLLLLRHACGGGPSRELWTRVIEAWAERRPSDAAEGVVQLCQDGAGQPCARATLARLLSHAARDTRVRLVRLLGAEPAPSAVRGAGPVAPSDQGVGTGTARAPLPRPTPTGGARTSALTERVHHPPDRHPTKSARPSLEGVVAPCGRREREADAVGIQVTQAHRAVRAVQLVQLLHRVAQRVGPALGTHEYWHAATIHGGVDHRVAHPVEAPGLGREGHALVGRRVAPSRLHGVHHAGHEALGRLAHHGMRVPQRPRLVLGGVGTAEQDRVRGARPVQAGHHRLGGRQLLLELGHAGRQLGGRPRGAVAARAPGGVGHRARACPLVAEGRRGGVGRQGPRRDESRGHGIQDERSGVEGGVRSAGWCADYGVGRARPRGRPAFGAQPPPGVGRPEPTA